jgi:Mannosyltransferase (PIG-V)
MGITRKGTNDKKLKLSVAEYTALNRVAELKPQSPLWSKLAERLRLGYKAISYPLTLFIGWRIGLTVLAFLAGWLIPAFAARNGVAPYNPPELDYWQSKLLGVWSHWDGEWFLHIAQTGYASHDANVAYFPLYPTLVGIIGSYGLGGNVLLAGVLVSLITGLFAFWLFYELVRHDFGTGVARKSLLYLTVFPTSFFLAATYSESLFLTLALGAFLAVRRYDNWWLAAILVGLAALTRNIGILLLIPLGWEWLRRLAFPYIQAKWQARKTPPEEAEISAAPKSALFKILLSGAVLAGVPILLFGLWPLYQWYTFGNPLRFMSAQGSWMWDRGFAYPWESVGRAIEMLVTGKGVVESFPAGFKENHNLTQLIFLGFNVLVLLVVGWQTFKRRLPFSYCLFYLIASIFPLFAPSESEPLVSYGRYILVAFPIYIVLAQVGGRFRLVHQVYLMLGLCLLTLLFSRFAGWYWVA